MPGACSGSLQSAPLGAEVPFLSLRSSAGHLPQGVSSPLCWCWGPFSSWGAGGQFSWKTDSPLFLELSEDREDAVGRF